MTEKQKSTLFEFIRYCFVGGIASVVDMAAFAAVRELVFDGARTTAAVVIGTTAGFVAGIIVNYILSMAVVFKTEEQQKKGRNKKALAIFVAVGIVGLGLSLALQWLGERIVLERLLETDHKLLKYGVKIIVMGIVLIWNYVGRKIFVFGGKESEK